MTSTTRVDTAAARMDISSLPREVLSTHVLSSDFLPEPADLGRLRAVSHAMRNAVDATGREIKEVSDKEAAKLGYVSLLKDCLLYTSPSPRDQRGSRMPSSA